MPADLLSELRAIVGEKHVHAAVADLAPYLEETRRLAKGTAIAAVSPANTAEVSAIVKACQAAGVSFVAQGGNTGLVGGACPMAAW